MSQINEAAKIVWCLENKILTITFDRLLFYLTLITFTEVMYNLFWITWIVLAIV
jgi:hypothetical protein